MEAQLESRIKLVDIEDDFSKIPTDLVISESDADILINKMKQLVESAETIKELQVLIVELQEVFYTSRDTLKSTQLHDSIAENINSPLYTDDKYNGILKLWAEFPETLIKVSSKKYHEFLIKSNSLPLSSYGVLAALDDLIGQDVSSKTGIDSTREVILHSMLLDIESPDATHSLDSDFSDIERRATRKLAVQFSQLDIDFDDLDISSRNLQKFRLLLDDVGFQKLITRILSKRALALD